MRRQMIRVCAQFEVHTMQFSLHMQSGSSQRSLGGSIRFFSFLWCEKASASRQGQRNIFSKKKSKRTHDKQERKISKKNIFSV